MPRPHDAGSGPVERPAGGRTADGYQRRYNRRGWRGANDGRSEAQVFLFATVLPLVGDGDAVDAIFGPVEWTDPSRQSQGVALASTKITEHGPPPGKDQRSPERVLRGLMSVGGDGPYPFDRRVVVSGKEGVLGGDTIALTTGPGAEGTSTVATPLATPGHGFAFAVEATLITGDVRLLKFDSPNRA